MLRFTRARALLVLALVGGWSMTVPVARAEDAPAPAPAPAPQPAPEPQPAPSPQPAPAPQPVPAPTPAAPAPESPPCPPPAPIAGQAPVPDPIPAPPVPPGTIPAPLPVPLRPTPLPTTSSLGEIVKQHNVDFGDGLLAVDLTVPATVVVPAGSTVACVVFFKDTAGNFIRSMQQAYMDGSGNVRAVSQDAVIDTGREDLDFKFRIPYHVFPKRFEGKYQVQALVRLIQRTASGAPILLASRSTIFWVEG